MNARSASASPMGRPTRARPPRRAAGTVPWLRLLRLAAAVAIVGLGLRIVVPPLVDDFREVTRPPEVHLAAPIPASRTLREPLSIVVLNDQSSSTDESDPDGFRFSESAEWVRWLADEASGPSDTLAVLHFADTVALTQPSTAVAGHRAALVDAVTRRPPVGDGTDLVAALAAAGDELGRLPTTNRRILILFTDGLVETSSWPQVRLAVDRLGADGLYLVALDVDGSYRRAAAPHWESWGLSGILRLDRVDAGAIAESLARVVLRETGQRVDGPMVDVK